MNIKNVLLIFFMVMQVSLGISNPDKATASNEYFTIKKITTSSPSEKQVTLELDHEISLSSLSRWSKKDKPRILPHLDMNWKVNPEKPNEIKLRGDFKAGKQYSLVFKPGFKIDGKQYKPTKSTFLIEPLSHISFFNENNVIEKNSRQLLHLNLTNVDRFTVQSTRIPPIYLPLIVQKYINWEETLKKLNSYHDKNHNEVLPDEFKDLNGEFIKDLKIFNFEKNFKQRPFSIPLTHRTDSGRGSIQLIKVKSENQELEAESPYTLLRITDIGITYKRSRKNLLVWITSLQKGTPLPEQKVYAIGEHSQLYFLGKTNSDGIIIFKPGKFKTMTFQDPGGYQMKESHLGLSSIKALIVLSRNDVSYIKVAKDKELYPEHLQKELEKSHDANLKAHVFTERGIYKPGDTVFFKGTLRKFTDGKVSPYKKIIPLKIENPKGEVVFESLYTPNNFGTLSGSLKLKGHFPMGTYTIFLGSENTYVTTRTFELQEFRAPRHKTHIAFDTETRKESEFANLERNTKYLKIKISGKYYVGGPLKNAQVRWKIFHGKTRFNIKDYENYKFGNEEAQEELIESSETILDEKGNAEFSFPVGSMVSLGKRSLIVIASVIDFDGRVATSKKVYQANPDYLVGMSKHLKTVKAGMDLPINFLVLNKEKVQEKEGKIKVNILRKGWNYIRKRNDKGEVYWEWKRLWKKVFSVEKEIKSRKVPFVFSNSYDGSYLVTASFSVKGKTFTSGTILEVEDGYDYYGHQNKSKAYEKITLVSDKSSYIPGAMARINFLPPQQSAAYLITFEREGVFDYRLLHTKDKNPSLEVLLNENHSPNIYVSVLGTLPRKYFPYYPSSIDEGAPNFQFGAINLKVLKKTDNLKIRVNDGIDSILKKPSSKGTLRLSVKDSKGIGRSAELAVGIIDERVLALTRYRTPNLTSLSRFNIPLEVGTSDLRSWLSKQTPLKMIWNRPITGGGGLEKSSASNTTLRSDFNPVAFFRSSLTTNSNGNLEIEYELPDSITSYRIYIVACDKGNGFGSTELSLIASKDFYIEPGLPRFFSKGDRFKFLVKAINNSETRSSLEVSSNATKHLNITKEDKNYFLEPMDSRQVIFKGKALSKGVASVHISGSLQNKTDAVQLEIPVQSGHTLGTDVIVGSFKEDTQLTLPIDQVVEKGLRGDELNESSELKVTFSRTPLLRMSSGIAYLLQYPYGCIEQTSSRLLPLVALRGLLRDGQFPDITPAVADKFIKAGVERLFMMQTDSGGFGYWPGNKTPHKLGTLYAMAALSIAKRNGVEVPMKPMQKSINYLKGLINNDESLKPEFVAFGSYVLSLNNAFKPSSVNILKRVTGKSTEADMFMLLARNNSGIEKQIMPKKKFWNIFFSARLDIVPPSSLDEFNARHRYKAVALLASQSIDPDHPLAHKMAKELLRSMESTGFWTSTSDTGWALYALGEYYKNLKFPDSNVMIHIGWGDRLFNEVLEGQKFETVDLNLSSKLRKDPLLKLRTRSKEPVYYKVTLKYPRLDYAEKGYSNGFQVSKTIENQSGTGMIRVGDIVKVKVNIDIKNLSYDNPYSYVVIDDPLPSGLVAINSAIKTEEQLDNKEDAIDYWNRDGTYKLVPNFVEFKDDRVLVFKDRMRFKGTHQYTYYARAIMEGDFVLPSTKVQLMYSPEVSGFTPKDKIQISGR